MFWDSTYILALIGAAVCAIASLNVNRTYKKYSGVLSGRGLTAEAVAEMILRRAGIYDVRIERVSGSLTDYYSPGEKVLKLSESVYGSTSVAAIGVAAHECGHAVQHNTDYVPLKVRSAIVPAANLGSQLFWPLFLIGLIFSLPMLVKAGIWLFVLALAFQVVTLPVEFDASRRALKMLSEGGMVTETEHDGVKKVLWAAAMTYVAAVIGSLLQLLRLLILSGAFRRNDD